MKGLAARADRYIGMDLEDPRIDFVRLAGSLGVEAERVEKTADVAPALARAVARGGPTLIDVPLDRAFKPA
jgi:benzoylformate decarboxylase